MKKNNNCRMIATFCTPDGVVDPNLYMTKDVYYNPSSDAVTSGSTYLQDIYTFHRRVMKHFGYMSLHLQIVPFVDELDLPF